MSYVEVVEMFVRVTISGKSGMSKGKLTPTVVRICFNMIF